MSSIRYFNTNKLTKPGVKTYFGYRSSQIKAIERAASFGKSKLLTNEEYNAMYDFEGLSLKYMLFTRYSDIKNQQFQFNNLDVKTSFNLTMDLMLLVINRKEYSYEEFLNLHSIRNDEISSEYRYNSMVEYYKKYRSLISRYREIVDDINGGINWANFLYKYELDVYGLSERTKFATWLDKVVPIKALLKKEMEI